MTEAQLEVLAKSKAVVFPTLTLLANMADWGDKVGVSARMVALCQTELKAATKILSRAREMGVPMAIGSEAGFSVTPYGEWHAREMELFVQYLGYSPMDAIIGMTRDNARILGFDNVGVIETGKIGDLIVVDGDRVADIRLLQQKSKIAAVVKDGVQISRPYKERQVMPYESFHPYAKERLTAAKVHA
jgi:imidazolonepropionase-like amidohydrolase